MSKNDQYEPYQITESLARYQSRLERPSQQALLCIDLQVLGCREGYGIFESHRDAGVAEHSIQYYLHRLDSLVIPNVKKLQKTFREAGGEVIHCRIQSLTQDGRDRSLEHKRLGLHAPPGSELAEFLPEVAPKDNEIVVNKTASGVFISTNLEYLLRNLGVQKLFISGVYTNECISSAVRSASDLGFDVRLISDATAAITQELHDATLMTTNDRYARVVTTNEAMVEVLKNG
ncbi:MAG: isochorismatase family cysteine hydrolase [Gammaproteobacteria bacterium]